jgi:hypothetical protein
VEWLVPWYSIADDPVEVAGMERELRRELSSGHPLYGVPVQAVGRRQDCDDVCSPSRTVLAGSQWST